VIRPIGSQVPPIQFDPSLAGKTISLTLPDSDLAFGPTALVITGTIAIEGLADPEPGRLPHPAWLEENAVRIALRDIDKRLSPVMPEALRRTGTTDKKCSRMPIQIGAIRLGMAHRRCANRRGVLRTADATRARGDPWRLCPDEREEQSKPPRSGLVQLVIDLTGVSAYYCGGQHIEQRPVRILLRQSAGLRGERAIIASNSESQSS
jgi:hypothetical protein